MRAAAAFLSGISLQCPTLTTIPNLTSSHALQLFIAELYRLISLVPEQILFAQLIPSFLGNRHNGIKVVSTLEFLLKPHIVFEFGKKG